VTGDRHRREEISLSVKYVKEIEEDLPGREIIQPVLGPNHSVSADTWKINRVFHLLCFVSLVCLGTLLFNPSPVVQVTVISIWTSTAALARFLLKNSYSGSRNAKRRT
jgi:hypothetical protein